MGALKGAAAGAAPGKKLLSSHVSVAKTKLQTQGMPSDAASQFLNGAKIENPLGRLQAANAQERFNKTYKNAMVDGNIGSYDKRKVNSADRDAEIANKQVQADQVKQHVQSMAGRARRLMP